MISLVTGKKLPDLPGLEGRVRCTSCKYDGLDTTISTWKNVRSGRKFPVCPSCGAHKRPHDSLSRTNVSVLQFYCKKIPLPADKNGA